MRPLLYYVWRGYAMSKKTTSLLKGLAVGLLVGCLAVECGKKIWCLCSPKHCRRRSRLQNDAHRAMRLMNNMAEDISAMFKK